MAGNGAVIEVDPPSDEVLTEVDVVLPADLTKGIHQLYLRLRNTSGTWSVSTRRTFFVIEDMSVQDIVTLEYYINSDPGLGEAQSIDIDTPSLDVSETLAIMLPDDLDQGINQLAVRARDQAGTWSTTQHSLFVLIPAQIRTDIVQVEYFMDQDPGVGQATFVNVPQTDSLDFTLPVIVPCLGNGEHTLYARVKDEQGDWSLYDSEMFTVEQGVAPPVITPSDTLQICPLGSLTLQTEVLDELDYQWMLDGEDIPGAVTGELTVSGPGEYVVRAICDGSPTLSEPVIVQSDSAACDCPDLGADIGMPCDDGNPATVGDSVQVDCECVGELVDALDEFLFEGQVTVELSPNPASDLMIVKVTPDTDEAIEMLIHDVAGRVVYQTRLSVTAEVVNEYAVDVSTWAPGAYSLSLGLGDERIGTVQMMVGR